MAITKHFSSVNQYMPSHGSFFHKLIFGSLSVLSITTATTPYTYTNSWFMCWKSTYPELKAKKGFKDRF